MARGARLRYRGGMRTALLVVFLGLSSACVAGCAADPHNAASVPGPLAAPGMAKVGDKTRCPISGEEFVVKADQPKVEYQGKTYYTCCPHCAEKLTADPKKYLEKAGT